MCYNMGIIPKGGNEMIYKVLAGNNKGKLIMIEDIDEVGGYVTDTAGKKYFIENVREATEQEIKDDPRIKIQEII